MTAHDLLVPQRVAEPLDPRRLASREVDNPAATAAIRTTTTTGASSVGQRSHDPGDESVELLERAVVHVGEVGALDLLLVGSRRSSRSSTRLPARSTRSRAAR